MLFMTDNPLKSSYKQKNHTKIIDYPTCDPAKQK